MKTYNYIYQNNHFLKNIDYSIFENEPNILIQIFCGQNKSTLEVITSILYDHIPHAVCIGTTTDGEIKDNKVSTLKSVITISVFEKTFIKSAMCEGEDSFKNGYKIAEKITTKNTKLIITFTDGTTTNGEEFLKGISAFDNSIMVCGGMAGDNGQFIQTYVSLGNKTTENGAVAVSLNSDILQVANDYKYDWSPIGITHTIDKIIGNRIYKISGMKATDFYKKYLGDSNSHTEFPLVVERNGIQIARALLTSYEDGSLRCAGNLYVGDKVRLGFANAELILKSPFEYLKNIHTYPAETFFIYSCMARRRYMQNLIKVEIEPFASIAPTSGFFTYAEFFHNNKRNELMNQTITLVGLSENPKLQKDISPTNNMVKPTESSYAKTIQALTCLIQQSAKDQALQEEALNSQIKYSEKILKNQKLFLRHAVHETNTPLSVIMSNIDLHEMEYEKSPYLENIEVALKNIFSIYDDLSYLVKKDQVEYKIYSIDLTDLIRNRIAFFKNVASQMSSKFIFQTDCEHLSIKFSETKLQRIIDNTLTNAIKYTFTGEPIKVKLMKNKECVDFSVSSHSRKIQNPDKIFDEYYREEKSKQGFGLGLNLVKRICDEEGIAINVYSNLHETCFTYSFKGCR